MIWELRHELVWTLPRHVVDRLKSKLKYLHFASIGPLLFMRVLQWWMLRCPLRTSLCELNSLELLKLSDGRKSISMERNDWSAACNLTSHGVDCNDWSSVDCNEISFEMDNHNTTRTRAVTDAHKVTSATCTMRTHHSQDYYQCTPLSIPRKEKAVSRTAHTRICYYFASLPVPNILILFSLLLLPLPLHLVSPHLTSTPHHTTPEILPWARHCCNIVARRVLASCSKIQIS
jgi:hypothetical protein